MKIIGKVFLVLLITLLTSGSLGPNKSMTVGIQLQQQLAPLKAQALNEILHRIYEGAWARASQYTDLQTNEMPKFPEESVHWTMKIESWDVDHDIKSPYWTSDIFVTGTTRALAWYRTDAGVRVEHGISLPMNAQIDMQVTLPEILQDEHDIEGILIHEMIHYIHHMRMMNQKGWMTIWPGDGHNYMAYLKYVKGCDFSANLY